MSKFRIGLGVTGGIAAYKAIEVMRLLQNAGCDVSVAMTRHATEFIKPLTFRALTDQYVIVDDYDPANPDPMAHINFSQNVDLLLIVRRVDIIADLPTAADDFLTSTYLASTARVTILGDEHDDVGAARNSAKHRLLKADGVHLWNLSPTNLRARPSEPGLRTWGILLVRHFRYWNQQTTDNRQETGDKRRETKIGGHRPPVSVSSLLSHDPSARRAYPDNRRQDA